MPTDDEMAEFEEQVSDIVDPSPFEGTLNVHNGQAVFKLVAELSPLLMDDILTAMNEGRASIVSYTARHNGTTVFAMFHDERNMIIKVALPPESVFFAAVPPGEPT